MNRLAVPLVLAASALISIVTVRAAAPAPATAAPAAPSLAPRVALLEQHATSALARACAQRAALTAEVNTRGVVLRSFLTSAADARQRSAEAEAASDSEQSNIDFQAATDFRGLAARVHDLPPATC